MLINSLVTVAEWGKLTYQKSVINFSNAIYCACT
jgi:hypothetical protein